MIAEDQDKFKEVMIGLGEYYNKEITEALVKIYWFDLKPLTIDQFMQACSAHRMNPDGGQFFPKTADIMKMITGTAKQQEQLVNDKAEMQWLVVEGQMRSIGSYGTLKLDDQQALAAIKSIGGWQYLCSLTADKLVWAKKEFISTYHNFERTPVEYLPEKLEGRFELENHKRTKNPSVEFQRLKDGIAKYRLENKEK